MGFKTLKEHYRIGTEFMNRMIRKLYFRIFKRYRRLEFRAVSYGEGDRLIRASVGKPEAEQWVLAIPEEDYNRAYNVVMLERRERIVM